MNHLKILKTDRLLQRPFNLSDACKVQRLANKFEIADTVVLIPHPYEDGMAEEWIKSQGKDSSIKKKLSFLL